MRSSESLGAAIAMSVHSGEALGEQGVLLVVEYDNRPRSRWVPFPISFDRLAGVAREAGLSTPKLIGRRDSAFGGTMYAATLRSSG